MEKQGVCGPKPRFLTGNILDMASLVSKSTSKDMDSIHHDIVGRLLPHFLVWEEIHILEWDRAEDVHNGDGADKRAAVEVQHQGWEIVAAATGLEALHRAGPADGQRR
ncbi:hypothetical protein C3L33_18657, partial [Rhododendron williamsianum]